MLTSLPLLAIFIYIIILLIKFHKSSNIEQNNQIIFLSGIILIFSGALGNFVDRIQNSCVLDFLDLHINNLHFFIFNIADFFISFGFFIILIDSIKKQYLFKKIY
jgi:signal peptidase II